MKKEKEIKLELTDAEWISLLDGTSDNSSLPTCCANISALRDELIHILRNGRNEPIRSWELDGLKQKLQWAANGHEFKNLPVIQKICKQLDFDPLKDKHEPQIMEI